MSDLVTALQLIISGNAAGAVAALEEVAAAEDKTAESTKGATAATDEQAGATDAAGAGMLSLGTISAAAGVAVAAGVALCVKSYANFGETIQKISELSGTSMTEASKLAGQWKQFGIDATSGATAMKFLEKNIGAAEEGNKAAITKFNELGLSMAALQKMTPDERIDAVREALSKVPDAAERTYLATSLLGRGASTMTLWYTASAQSIDKVNQSLEQTGQIISKADTGVMKEGLMAWRMFKAELQGVEFTIARMALPAIIGLVMMAGVALRVYILPVIKDISAIFAPLGQLVVWVFRQMHLGASSAAVAVGVLNPELVAMRLLFGGLAEFVKNLVKGIKEWATTHKQAVNEIRTDLHELGTDIQSLWTNAQPILKSLAGGFAAVAPTVLRVLNLVLQLINALTRLASIPKGIIGGAESIVGGAVGGVEKFAGSFAGGGSFTVNQPTFFQAGEAGAENVNITPVGSGGSGGAQQITVSLAGANFYGSPDARTAKLWAPALTQALGEAWYTLSHGAGH